MVECRVPPRRLLPFVVWALALVPFGLLCLALKRGPLWVLVGLFALHGLARLARVRWLETATQLVALCLTGGAAAATAAYQVSIWIAPARTAEGHPVMPVGQAFLGLLAGVLAGVVLLVLYLRRWRHEPARSTVGLLLHLAGLVALAVALYTTLRLT
jgi:hypothetical protein